jgi:hypothetical protein
MSKNIVDANYRFISASQEVNARITQRQQALTLYVTLQSVCLQPWWHLNLLVQRVTLYQ